MTINLGGQSTVHGDWPTRCARAVAIVRDQAVDILAAQAVPADGLVALTSQLPTFRGVASTGGAETTSALVAREALGDVLTQPLSRFDSEDSFARTLLAATGATSGAPVTIINAHVSWVDAQARANVDELLRFAENLSGDVLLVGDLNQSYDSAAIGALTDAGWTDAWRKLRRGESGETFPTGDLSSRIDYVWARGTTVQRLQSIELVGGEGDAALSDHLGLLVTLT